MTATTTNTRDHAAYQVVRAWADDWAREGAREPRAGEIVRALAHVGYAGWRRTYREVYGGAIRSDCQPALRLTRSREVTRHGNGWSGRGSVSCVNRERAARLADRYSRFHAYMTEMRHGWQVVRTLSFADNSTEVIERSALTGETRQRMTVYPHGDTC